MTCEDWKALSRHEKLTHAARMLGTVRGLYLPGSGVVEHDLWQPFAAALTKLCSSGTLLPTLEGYARILKSRHQYWMDTLHETEPASHPRQIASAALTLAVGDLQETLSADSPPVEDGWEPSLDEAITYVRRRTPPA